MRRPTGEEILCGGIYSFSLGFFGGLLLPESLKWMALVLALVPFALTMTYALFLSAGILHWMLGSIFDR